MALAHTIFTPAYNRAGLLRELFGHMVALDYPREDFEWLIIDDGSQDDTPEVVQGFLEEGTLNIRYVHQENRGIHVAQNQAVRLARGRFVTRIDTDDHLTPTALTVMDQVWATIPEDRRNGYAGVVGATLNPDGSPRSSVLPRDPMDATGVLLRTRYEATGDRSFCIRTEVIRRFHIPEYADTKYVPESIMWRRIDREYTTRFTNAAFSVCGRNADGSMMLQLTSANRTPSNARSPYYLSWHCLNEFADQLTGRETVLYARSGSIAGTV